MFRIIMQSMPLLVKKVNLSEQDIYDAYISSQQDNELQKIKDQQQQLKIMQTLIPFKQNTSDSFKELCEYIAVQLHLTGNNKINQKSDLFKVLDYEDTTLFSQQKIFHILKILPLKIKTKNLGYKYQINQEIEIGFIHDIIKNYYLFEAIKDEINKTGTSQILSAKSIVKNVRLVKLITDSLVYDEKLQDILRKFIDQSKHDKSEQTTVLASNSITLLVSAQYAFSGEDLSNISIKGANLSGGIFQYTDFTEANLEVVNFTNADMTGAEFIKSNMKEVKLSISPDFKGGRDVVYFSFSPDSKFIVAAHNSSSRLMSIKNECITIYDVENRKPLEGTTIEVDGIAKVEFSPDGTKIAFQCYADKTFIIDLMTGQELDLEGRDDFAFLYDNFIAVGLNKDIVMYDYNTGKTIKTLIGHNDDIKTIMYLRNNFIVSESIYDQKSKIIKIWDVKTGKCLNEKKEDSWRHSLKTEQQYNCITHSPDGEFIVTASNRMIFWKTATAQFVQFLDTDSDIKCITYSPDGQFIASSNNRTIKIWNIESKEFIMKILSDTEIEMIRYSPDGNIIGYLSGVALKVSSQVEEKLIEEMDNNLKFAQEISQSLSKSKLQEISNKKLSKLVKIVIQEKVDELQNQPHQNIQKKNNYLKSCHCEIYVIKDIIYDNPLLNNSQLFKQLADMFGVNKVINNSTHLTELFGSETMEHICNTDTDLLQDLLGNYANYY